MLNARIDPIAASIRGNQFAFVSLDLTGLGSTHLFAASERLFEAV